MICIRGGSYQFLLLVINKHAFHIGQYGPPSRSNWTQGSNCFWRESVPVFPRKPIATCNFRSVVECWTRDRRAAAWSLIGVNALCPWAIHINPSFVLVQPRKTHLDITERLLTQIKQTKKNLWLSRGEGPDPKSRSGSADHLLCKAFKSSITGVLVCLIHISQSPFCLSLALFRSQCCIIPV